MFKVYELLFKYCIGIVVDNGDEGVYYFLKIYLKLVGFEEYEVVVFYLMCFLLVYRLLVENFIFFEKFKFFEL